MTSIGLTGNIASGKSHIAEIFASFGVAVQDSDKIAHSVMENEAFDEIAALFPEAIIGEDIDRKKLGSIVFANDEKLKKLEAILHPKVRMRNLNFIERHKNSLALIEIPLLFETEAEKIFDYIAYVDVNEKTQTHRALARGLTKEKLEHIIARQHKISPNDKKSRSHFVIDNNEGSDAAAQVKDILAKIKDI